MLIPSMGGCQEWMSLLVVKQHQRSASKAHSQAPNQSSRDEHLAVDRLTMSIEITGERMRFIVALDFWMPEIGCPPRQGIREAFCTTHRSELRQESFGVTVAVGPLAPGKPCQTPSSVTAQIPGAMQPNRPQKQQRQQESSSNYRSTTCQWGARRGCILRQSI